MLARFPYTNQPGISAPEDSLWKYVAAVAITQHPTLQTYTLVYNTTPIQSTAETWLCNTSTAVTIQHWNVYNHRLGPSSNHFHL